MFLFHPSFTNCRVEQKKKKFHPKPAILRRELLPGRQSLNSEVITADSISQKMKLSHLSQLKQSHNMTTPVFLLNELFIQTPTRLGYCRFQMSFATSSSQEMKVSGTALLFIGARIFEKIDVVLNCKQ